MFEQDSGANADQDDAADDLGGLSQPFSGAGTDEHADGGKNKGGNADRRRHNPDIHVQKRERHPDRRRIDRRADRCQDKNRQPGLQGIDTRLAAFFAPGTEAFADQMRTDQTKQRKGDPVINAFHETRGEGTEKPSNYRRDGFDDAKHQPALQGIVQRRAMRRPLADSRGEGIGGHAERQQQDSKRRHGWASITPLPGGRKRGIPLHLFFARHPH